MQVFTLPQLLNLPVQEHRFIVDPILPQNGKVLIYGEAGSLKSWFLLWLGLIAASGAYPAGWTGLPCSSVLYIDEEMPLSELQRRTRLLVNGGMALYSPPVVFGSHWCLNASKLATAVLALYPRPALVIIETLRRVIEGEENEAKDVTKMWGALDRMAVEGITVVLSHHMRKPVANVANDTRYRASGSTDLLAGCDVAYGIIRQGPGIIGVECVKNRLIQEPAPFRMQLTKQGVGEWWTILS